MLYRPDQTGMAASRERCQFRSIGDADPGTWKAKLAIRPDADLQLPNERRKPWQFPNRDQRGQPSPRHDAPRDTAGEGQIDCRPS